MLFINKIDFRFLIKFLYNVFHLNEDRETERQKNRERDITTERTRDIETEK